MKTVAIYVLIDPITNECRYVGRSIQPKARFWTHLQTYDDSHKSRWIKKLRDSGTQPVMIELERVLPSKCNEAEIFWIALMKFMGANLTNGTCGGDGLINPSQVARNNISIAQKKRFQDPEQRAICSAGTKALWVKRELETGSRRHSEQHRAKLVASLKSTATSRAAKLAIVRSTPESKAKSKASQQKRWDDPVERQRLLKLMKQACNTPEIRAKRSETMKQVWHKRKLEKEVFDA